MLKAVLDTSVIVSAFLKHEGVNARILQKGKDHYQIYLSEDILEETRRVLFTYDHIRKKYHYSDHEAEEFLEALNIVAKKVFKRLPKIKVIAKDPKDDPVLACALKSKADYIVSKDDHLKDLREYKGIKIVSSQDFLEVLQKYAEELKWKKIYRYGEKKAKEKGITEGQLEDIIDIHRK